MKHRLSAFLVFAMGALVAAVPISSRETTGVSQQPSSRAGLILGKVVDGASEAPVSGARVAITGRDVWTVTDRDGSFVFFDLPPGSYQLTAMKNGHAPGETGQRWIATTRPLERPGRMRSPHSQAIVLRPDDRLTDIEIRLWKHGSIGGRVTDELADPIAGLQIQAWPERYSAGRRWFDRDFPATAMTDDRGVYRLPSLIPGNYIVVVSVPSITVPASFESPAGRWDGSWSVHLYRSLRTHEADFPAADSAARAASADWLRGTIGPPPPPARDLGYASTFHPGATSPSQATVVSVRPGAGVEGIDVTLTPVRAVTINGTAIGPDGPRSSVGLTLVASDAGDADSEIEVGVALTGPDGRFMFDRVPMGTYEIRALDVPKRGRPQVFVPRAGSAPLLFFETMPWTDLPTLWASVPVATGDRDIDNLVVDLRPGYRLQGSLRLDGSMTRPGDEALRGIRLSLDRPDGRPSSARPSNEIALDETLRLRSIQLPPGCYYLRVSNLPPGWEIASATIGGHDISLDPVTLPLATNADLVVTLTDRRTVVSGRVRTDVGNDAGASVALFTTNRTRWRDYGDEPRDIVFARTDMTGLYSVSGVPAGEYFLVAVDDRVLAGWNSSALLERLSAVADQQQIVAGQVHQIDLVTRVIP